jgi:hypothetical protein
VSDQSPWGAPPPSGPYGGQAQPPQPPYQPGGTGGWGGGPPSYGVPLNQGPQGPKKRTGLIIGVVAVVLLVAVAFTVTLLVVKSNKDDKDDKPDQASSSEPTSDPTASDPTATEPTGPVTSPAEPTSDPTESSAPPVGDGDIVGDGYSYDLPATGWKDATSEAKGLADTIDTAIILGSSIDLSQSSIIVEALSAGGAESLEDLEPLWKRNLSSSDSATPVDIADSSIDGERAIGVRIEDRVNDAGDPITQIAYLALHNGNQYSIGLSFPKTGDDVSEDDFKKMLDSWKWTS